MGGRRLTGGRGTGGGDPVSRIEPFGAAAVVVGVVLLVVQLDVFESSVVSMRRTAPLFLWQGMVVTFAAVGTVARAARLRIALYILGAIAAVLYGLLSWAAAGAVDLLVALLLVVGTGRSILGSIAP